MRQLKVILGIWNHKLHLNLSRRSLLTLIGSSLLSACTQVPKPKIEAAVIEPPVLQPDVAPFAVQPDYAQLYAAVEDGGYSVPATPYQSVKPELLRQEVVYVTDEPPGTIIVDTATFHLFFILAGGRAIRYGVGLGAAGRSWKGRAIVHYKRMWPRWTVPDDMVKRNPHLRQWGIEAGGMPPGLQNPLGSRALYIFQDGVDTLYRIHGSPDWKSIGKNASSGCVRMYQQDVMDLYNRIRGKHTLVVL